MSFRAKLSFPLDCLFGSSLSEKPVASSRVYGIVKKLTATAFPSQETEFDRSWDGFYFPLRRSGRLVCLPFRIMEYEGRFFVSLKGSMLRIEKGNEKVAPEYAELFSDALRLIPVLKREGSSFLQKNLPYDIRTGRILGKHVMPKLMPSGQSCRILSAYAAAQNLSVSAISLDDYLDTAAVCYRSAFKRAKSLSPEQMYRRWADRRDAGMLSVKPRRSAAAFSEWLAHASGGHPFEIVFSWIEHGIHLYPPRKEAPHYTLALTNYDFAGVFAAMVKALIKEEVAFRASGLEDVLRFLRGESYFRVNEHDDNTFFYVPSMEHRRDYFPHIEWDGLKLPVWR